MKLDLITVVTTLLAISLLGTVGAFLLYVPVMTVATVATILLGAVLMFALGLHLGRRRIRIVGHKTATALPHWSADRAA